MKRQKRFWTWTKKQKQKSRNHKHSSDAIPKKYFDAFKKSYKGIDKRAISSELNGQDGNYANWNRLRAEVSWSWW